MALVYIRGMGNISPQKTWGEDTPLAQASGERGDRLTCIEPDYSKWIDARQLRRMSRILRMGVAASAMALKEAGIEKPDGIITGTGYGCLDDTGTFLTKMVQNNEEALNPTPFIQSTHNTIGSQIALLLQCQGYNQTFTHGAFSFESALIDAILQLEENAGAHLLVGGVDEITPVSHAIQRRFGIYRNHSESALNLFKQEDRGTLNGEGSSWFVLTGKPGPHDLAGIAGVATCSAPGRKQWLATMDAVLAEAGVTADAVDLVLLGKSGDAADDQFPEEMTHASFPASSIGLYKHLCGEYPVASAFALWLGARIMHDHHIPDVVVYRDTGRALKNILIYNPYFGSHHAFILLQTCRDIV